MSLPVDPAPPPELHSAAVRCFGDRLPTATRYASLLMTDGVVRGLIGPRESARLWDRHLLNCAVVADLLPPASRVIDVGSGAGLPGVVLAIARPDLTMVLVEPMARRATFLAEAVTALDLAGQTIVVRARAEELIRGRARVEPADIVTARAVAPLDRLAVWCLPLVRQGGQMLALKGDSAADEVDAHRTAVARAGGGTPIIRRCGENVVATPTTVVEIEKR
ncbi:MAG TPA: 16S rRNA (guanine(527)-N(7))-methyltransferase RsmG [Jiangellales bacterium]|nr:16S rRNA (guanine(527)-N(7))-methyltransferase RsmG [Jiangellales bacterium]